MAATSHGFFFKYFDKIFLAVGVLGLLGSVYYVFTKSKVSREEDPRILIERYKQQIEKKLEEKAPPLDKKKYDYVSVFQERYRKIPEAELMRKWIVHRPRPIIYPVVYLGLNKTKVLEFAKPLDRGTVRCDKPWLADVYHGNHPFMRGKPFNLVMVKTHNQEGVINIIGLEGPRPHRMPCIISKDVDRVVLPPVNLVSEVQRGRIRIGWDKNPENQRGQLKIIEYHVYKKRLRDVIEPFRQIGVVKARTDTATISVGGGGRQPIMVGPVPRGRTASPAGRGRTTAKPEKKASDRDYWFEDDAVAPDEIYLYKVCTKAEKSYPPISKFTPELKVKTLPDVDFAFTGGSSRLVQFIVYKVVDGQILTHRFKVKIGEPIGKVVYVKDLKKTIDFRTGCYLLDYFRRVFGPIYKNGEPTGRRGYTMRIIFEDKNGNGGLRWRNEVASKELIAAVTPTRRGTRRRRRGGRKMPDEMGPEVLRPEGP